MGRVDQLFFDTFTSFWTLVTSDNAIRPRTRRFSPICLTIPTFVQSLLSAEDWAAWLAEKAQ